jgi:hypothetical protein
MDFPGFCRCFQLPVYNGDESLDTLEDVCFNKVILKLGIYERLIL